MGLGLLGNDERLFTGVGVQSMQRVIMVVGQGAAVPHRGLSNIQDLITHCLLVVEESPERDIQESKEEADVNGVGGFKGVRGK